MGTISRGLGGGGAMFAPAISPWPAPHPDEWFVACDMGGLYRSTDRGLHWTMLDGRDVAGDSRFSVAFDPTTPGRYVARHPRLGLRERRAGAGWAAFPVALPKQSAAPGAADVVVTAAAFRPLTGELVLGTTQGIYTQAVVNGAATWQRASSGDPARDAVSDVLGFAFLTVNGAERMYAATTDRVLESPDGGVTWAVIGDAAAAHASGLPARGPNARPIRGFAGGVHGTARAQGVALYVTLEPSPATPQTDSGGVFCTLPAGAASVWTRVMGSLPIQPGGVYEHLAVPAHGAHPAVYVTCVAPGDLPSDFWVWRGALTLPPGAGQPPQATWTGIYHGYQQNRAKNIDPAGWADLDPPDGLGWGFGGRANGLAIDPKNGDVLVYTNNAVVHATDTASQPAVRWAQRYSEGPAGDGTWRTVGLDVTTTWQYAVNAGVHLLCSTDIGLARSATGDRWVLATDSNVVRHADGAFAYATRWGNFYHLEFPTPDGQTVWAAVSTQHDIPHESEQNEPPTLDERRGAVLRSPDNGVTWTVVAGSRRAANPLPTGARPWESDAASGLSGEHPVVSILARDIERASSPGTIDSVLFASAWGDGVYWSDDQGVNWRQLGTFPAPPAPHCYRLWYDAASGDLFCNAAARRAGGALQRGGLFRLPGTELNPPAAGSPALGAQRITTPWVDVTQGLNPGGTIVLNPVDFALDAAGNLLVATANQDGVPGGGRVGGGGLYRGLVTRGPQAAFNVGWSANLLAYATLPDSVPYTDARPLTPALIDGWLYLPTLYTGILAAPYDDPSAAWEPAWTPYHVIPFAGAQRVVERRTSPASGSVYVLTFGGGAWELERRCAFGSVRPEIARADVAPGNPGAGAPVRVERVADLVIDGFTERELGFSVGGTAATPHASITASVAGAAAPGVAVAVTAAAAAPGVGPNVVGWRAYTLALDFTDVAAFPAQPGPPVALTLTFARGEYSCQATVSLTDAVTTRPVFLRAANYPGLFVRHSNFLGELTAVVTALDERDAGFVLVPGFADPAAVSFASTNFPGYYLRDQQGRLTLQQRPAADASFDAAATFRQVPGLATATLRSFRAFSDPSRYIRHRDFHVYVEADDGTNSRLFRADSTFDVAGRADPPVARPECTAAADDLKALQDEEAALVTERNSLDRNDPADKPRLMQIQNELAGIRRRIRRVQEQAQDLHCPP